MRSVLRLALDGKVDAAATHARISLSVALEGYHNLSILCENVLEDDKLRLAAKKSQYNNEDESERTFWLCW